MMTKINYEKFIMRMIKRIKSDDSLDLEVFEIAGLLFEGAASLYMYMLKDDGPGWVLLN